MNTVTKVALSLVLGVIAIGAQSFKNVQHVKTADDPKIYYHVGNEYVLTPPEDTLCDEDDDYKCTLTYSGSTLPPNSSYPEDAFPIAGYTLTQSSQAGSYQ